MEPITKRMQDSFDEIKDITNVEKKVQNIEFLSGIMAGHQHRISLTLRTGKIVGKTERVNGHVHKVDQGVIEGDILGFTDLTDNHKHRLNFTVKELKLQAKKEREKK